MDICIKNGTIVNAHEIIKADLGIHNGKIVAIGEDLTGLENIDAHGKYLFPGLIEVHSHLEHAFENTRSIDNFFVGSQSAVAGGVTTLIDTAQVGSGESITKAIKRRKQVIEPQVAIDYSLHIGLTDIQPAQLDEIPSLIQNGYSSYEIFLYGPQTKPLTDVQVFQLLEVISQGSANLSVRCGNHFIFEHTSDLHPLEHHPEQLQYYPQLCPPISESSSIQRMLVLTEPLQSTLYISHLSCELALKQIYQDTNTHTRLYTSTTLPYLTHTQEVYKSEKAHQFTVLPPLRETHDQRSLWKALQTGTIQIVSSAPQAYTLEQKKLATSLKTIPPGLSNMELLLPLMYHLGVGGKHIDLMQMVSVLSTNPAKIFGLIDKGSLLPGKDADVVVFDPLQKQTISASNHLSRCDFSIYEGMEIQGKPEMTLSRGRIVYEQNTFTGEQGMGQFIPRTV